MLRQALIVIVSVLLAGLIIVDFVAHGAAIPFTFAAAVVLIGLIFENHRYRSFANVAPGGTFQPTGERFIDPDSGKLVEVHSDPASGARRYVEIGDAPDTP